MRICACMIFIFSYKTFLFFTKFMRISMRIKIKMSKVAVNCTIDIGLRDRAREERINLSEILENQLKKKLLPTLDELHRQKQHMENRHKEESEDMKKRIAEAKKNPVQQLKRRGMLKLTGHGEEIKWLCPECGIAKNYLTVRKCVRVGCGYHLNYDEWNFIKTKREQNQKK